MGRRTTTAGMLDSFVLDRYAAMAHTRRGRFRLLPAKEVFWHTRIATRTFVMAIEFAAQPPASILGNQMLGALLAPSSTWIRKHLLVDTPPFRCNLQLARSGTAKGRRSFTGNASASEYGELATDGRR
jgi:hypothetical protein